MLHKYFYCPNPPIPNHSYSVLLTANAAFQYTVGDAKLPLAYPGCSLLGHIKANISLQETP